MPSLNFQTRFAEDVRKGFKRQSIRAPRKDGRAHAKVGDTLKLYTGQRTKDCRLLGEATVTRIAKVVVHEFGIFLDGAMLPIVLISCWPWEMTHHEFARLDGFADFAEMRDFFEELHGLPFEGVVIFWSEPR
jgi:hypothetical protein